MELDDILQFSILTGEVVISRDVIRPNRPIRTAAKRVLKRLYNYDARESKRRMAGEALCYSTFRVNFHEWLGKITGRYK